ncbi:MAG: hypothetical protein JSR33_03975 [Proteobacteria bacterium]|nr:hypothetical protein [Pseudomonadota bacterium]
MKIIRHFVTAVSASCLIAGSALADPTINITFLDQNHICNTEGKTAFSFNYKYLASGGLEYYSGPIFVTKSPALFQAKLPESNPPHYFTDFEITDQGDCGGMDLDYQHLGNCYQQNLIPESDQQNPHSYQIILIPQATGNSSYGRPMYNLTCKVITKP